jgi:hypothetical protein
MYDRLDKYFAQFDRNFKFNPGEEMDNRWKLINKQRIEAIEKNQPLPIRPMGMELDPCYKK